MSGLINQVGAKSGVIGYTELDYEKGIFTPSCVDGGTSFGYNTGNWGTFGEYIRTGNVVHVSGRVVLTSGSMNTGTLTIGGLPFNQRDAGTGDVPMFVMYLAACSSVPSNFTQVAGHLNTNTNQISTRALLNTGAQTAFQGVHFGSSGNINFSGHYFIYATTQ